MTASTVGPLVLGALLGYLTHYLVRRDPDPGIQDLGAIIASLLGGAALGALGTPSQVDWYLVGLGVGFFLYWAALAVGRERTGPSSAAGAEDASSNSGRRPTVRLFPFLPFLRQEED